MQVQLAFTHRLNVRDVQSFASLWVLCYHYHFR